MRDETRSCPLGNRISGIRNPLFPRPLYHPNHVPLLVERHFVHKGADKTDAKQTNKNLLLSDNATVDTKPQLEIYAEDVRCTHGATIGQMNPEQIFYLRARGINEEAAKRMIMHAFAGEIVQRIQCEPVRGELDRLVWDRLEGMENV